MKKILIIGSGSYLATGLNFNTNNYCVDKIRRPFVTQFERYNEYDYIINFCIQPEHFCSLLCEDEMIDVSIAKYIKNAQTKYIFSSSRKVYGSTAELREYKEDNELKPYDFYSKNKVNIEKKLKEILGNNLIILRTGNILGMPSNKSNYATFIGWIENEFNKNGKITVTVDKNARKDFITKDYFQQALVSLIDNDCTGVYNIGSNFALTVEELIQAIFPKEYINYSPKELNSEQFILNCSKLYKHISPITKGDLIEYCKKLGGELIEHKSKIPIFLPSDNNYAPYLAVTMASILSNTNSFIEFYILDSGITIENKEKIKKLHEKFNSFTLEFLEIDHKKYFTNCTVTGHLNLSTYNRLLIAQLKPELDKVIYLDSDIVVLNDIRKLYDIDLENYIIGAAWDKSRILYNLDTKEPMELSENYKYFNAGVLLIDLHKWKEQDVLAGLFKINEKYSDKILHADETLLNKYFDNKYKILDIKFNYTDYDILNSPNKEIYIRHFASPFKPWNSNFCFLEKRPVPLKCFENFWIYAKLTEFYDEIKKTYEKAINRTSFIKRMSLVIEKMKGDNNE